MPDQKQIVTDEELENQPDFEKMMLVRVNRDVSEAIEFTKPLRQEYLDSFQLYNRSSEYDKMRESETYPTDFYGQLIATFTSSMMKPLWSKDEPCSLTPGPNTSPEEVEVKQKLHAYQNREDSLKETHRIAIQDIATYGIGIVKTDFVNITETVWGTEERDVPPQRMQEIDPLTQQVVGEFDQPVIDPETGQQATETISVPKESILYKGPHSERIDPQNFFFNVDKRRGDTNPVMIRDFVDKDFFDTQDFFFNQGKLKDIRTNDTSSGHDEDKQEIEVKRRILGMQDDASRSRKEFVYFEWQGLVNKKKLFKYLGPKFEKDIRTEQMVDVHSLDIVSEDEKVMCICGVVNGAVVVRLDKFFLDHGNIVVGIMAPIDNEMVGDSIGRQAKPGGKMMDILFGIMFKSLRVAVNRGHGINVNAVEGGAAGVPDVNQDAWVLKCLENPAQVHKIIDQPSVAKDVYQAQALVERATRDRTAVSEVSSGKADPNAETLGENLLVSQETGTRSEDPLEIIEDGFIIPIARLRDEINMLFLTDPEYLIEVIGEEGVRDWVPLAPEQIRAHTRFMCESSGRESQKATITQQLLQANQIAPNALAAGQAVRLDRMLHDLMVDGFGTSEEKAGFYFPAVRLELETGSGEQMDQVMASNQQMAEQLKALQLQQQIMLTQAFPLGVPQPGQENGQGGSTTSPGQELPQPTNEEDAAQSLNQLSQPDNVGV